MSFPFNISISIPRVMPVMLIHDLKLWF